MGRREHRRTLNKSVPSSQPSPRLSIEALEDRRLLAVFTVANANDSGPDSLRAAITAANSSAGADEIVFESSVTGTISLQSQLPTISDHLTITGPGASNLTLDASGGGAFGIFHAEGIPYGGGEPPEFVEFTLTGATLTGGNSISGAAIGGFYADLNVSDSVITGNTGTAFSGSVGVSVIRSTSVIGNTGVGVSIDYNSLSLVDSTVSGNTSRGVEIKGGTFYGGPGYEYPQFSRVDAINSTISGNSAAGLLVDYNSTLNLDNSTVTGNQGGGIVTANTSYTSVSYDPIVHSNNSIVAGNTSGGSPRDVDGEITANFSLIQSLASTTLLAGSGNNITGQDPMLGPLQNNGGPTATHALLPGSPAINMGDPAITMASDMITPVSVASSTSANDFLPASALIDGSGLPQSPTFGNYESLLHADGTAGTNSWVTEGFAGDYYNSGPTPVLEFSLGGNHTVTDLVVWGYQFGGPNNNEAKTFEIAFSTNGGATYHNTVTVSHQRTGGEQETISLGGSFTANHIRVTIVDNHFGTPGSLGGDRVGLGEVRFLNRGPFDQRGPGFPRVLNGRMDIGAVEQFVYDSSAFVVTVPNDEFDLSNNEVSLREAIDAANKNPGIDTVTFAPNMAGEVIVLGGSHIEISEGIHIDAGDLGDDPVVSGANQSRIFDITATTGDMTFTGFFLSGGQAPNGAEDGDGEDGGAFRSATTGSLILNGTNITDSSAGDGGNPDVETTAGNGGSGGAIFAAGDVVINNSRLTGNTAGAGGELGPMNYYPGAAGDGGAGGAIFSTGNVTLNNAFLNNNNAGHGGSGSDTGDGGRGGGILAGGNVSLTRSTVSGNSAGNGGSGFYSGGYGGDGGGIRAAGSVTLVESTVSGNSAGDGGTNSGNISNRGGYAGDGGGVLAFGGVTAISSTISYNAAGNGGDAVGDYPSGAFGGSGGGIRAFNGATILGSTISGNTAGDGGDASGYSSYPNMGYGGDAGSGGGLLASQGVTITSSTITGNSTGNAGQFTGPYSGVAGSPGSGGGVLAIGNAYNTTTLDFHGNIIAGNTSTGTAPELRLTGGIGMLSFDYNILEDTSGSGITASTGSGNLLNLNPQIGFLENNGGPTLTHLPLEGSPVIDMGDPSIVLDPDEFDQRGSPFFRTVGGRIDIGAVELQSHLCDLFGDADNDFAVSGSDLLAVTNNFGATGPADGLLLGDADADGAVSGSDLLAVTNNFGATCDLLVVASEPAPAAAVAATPVALYESPTNLPGEAPSRVTHDSVTAATSDAAMLLLAAEHSAVKAGEASPPDRGSQATSNTSSPSLNTADRTPLELALEDW